VCAKCKQSNLRYHFCMEIDTLTIVGVGLIGGSIGLAARQRGLARRIRGVGRSQTSLDKALAVGAIDEGFLDLKAGVAGANVAVFCAPVDRIAEQVLQAAPACAQGALLTDAGSTKCRIVTAVEAELPARVAFVGAHPLAGSEKRGPAHAETHLFQGRWTILTPTPSTDPSALQRAQRFWQALGARVRLMNPHEHDRALAVTSHLPHLLASALAGILPPELCDFTATGFRDTTRVAGGDPELWAAIFEHNQALLLDALGPLENRLAEFRAALAGGDWSTLKSLLVQAKKVRDALGS
jgi:prephenate dehydrogenase